MDQRVKRTQRDYTLAFKQAVVSQVESGELHRDWRNDIEGFGCLLTHHLPAYANLMQSYTQRSHG